MTAGARLLRDTTLYTLGIAVARFANLLLLPLYLSVLSRQQFGILGICEQLVNVLVMLTAAGVMETLLKLTNELHPDADAQRRLVVTMTTWMLVVGVALALLCILVWPLIGTHLGGIGIGHSKFEFAVGICQFTATLGQMSVPLFKLGQHPVETIGQQADFIVFILVSTQGEVLLQGNPPHRI